MNDKEENLIEEQDLNEDEEKLSPMVKKWMKEDSYGPFKTTDELFEFLDSED